MWPGFCFASRGLVFQLFALPDWEVGVRGSVGAAGLRPFLELLS